MKLMIASDLHGSSYFVSKLAERIEIAKPDKVLLLGDLLYHGPRNNLPELYDTKVVAKISQNAFILVVVAFFFGNVNAIYHYLFPPISCL